MYSYNDVEKIKFNLEWIVNQATTSHLLPTPRDQEAIQNLQQLIQTYEGLLESIAEFGISVIDTNLTEALSLTEKLIYKIKLGMEAM
ncbi:hypothetical protein DVZ67_18530 [Salmonella enterica subsp. enterica serovar Saintpaul]|nr:hypothetical protein [Salmonella enterica subsp. enterica serovar Saintpaul]